RDFHVTGVQTCALPIFAPAMGVEASMAPLPGSEPLTALEHEGLKVYIAEGCVACHTQQVRPLAMDEVWGRAAVPADFAHVGPLRSEERRVGKEGSGRWA